MNSPLTVVQDRLGAALEADLARGTNRERVAGSPWLPPTLAARLARSHSRATLRALGRNPRCPEHLLVRLAAHADTHVAASAVTNRALPFEAAADAVARHGLSPALSPHCPSQVLQQLAGRPRADLRDILSHRNCPDAVRQEALRSGRYTQAERALSAPQSTHTDFTTALAHARSDRDTRLLAWRWAEHPGADPGWLATHVQTQWDGHDRSNVVHVARNPAAPAETLHRIATGHSAAADALANPSCPPATLGAVAATVGLLQRGVGGYRRLAIAHHPAAPLSALAVLDRDDVTTVEEFTLAHARTAAHATVILEVAPTWTGSLAELLTVTMAAAR